MKLYGGIDLHSNNNYVGIIDRKEKKVFKKKLPNDMEEGNSKNGNKYLSWAYVEAVNAAKRDYSYVRRYYQKKMAKTNNVVAIKAISHKLARACYYIIKNQEVFNPQKAFG